MIVNIVIILLFFAEKANTGILIDKTFPVVGYSNFSNVGNLVVVSTDDNQYLNFLSVYLTNTSSLKKFEEYYNHLISSDKTGKTSIYDSWRCVSFYFFY